MSDASDEIWKGKFQFVPLNIGIVKTSFLRSTKAISHLSVHSNSTFPIKLYNGVNIF